jgi:hypothetical protein
MSDYDREVASLARQTMHFVEVAAWLDRHFGAH